MASASDVDLVNDLAIEFLDKVERQRQASKVLCRCQACSVPGVPLWERVNFIHRSKAAKHCREEREKNNLPPLQRGPNAGQSFWKPEDVVTVFKHEALQALQEEAAAGHSITHTFTSRRCALGFSVPGRGARFELDAVAGGGVMANDAADDTQWDIEMVDAAGADPDIADAGDHDSADCGTDFVSPAQQENHSQQQQP